MNTNERPGGSIKTTGPEEVIQPFRVSPETRSAVNVSATMTGAAGALGVPPAMLELLTPDAARLIALQRLREAEGLIELLGRHTDSLEAFLKLLVDLPAGVTIGAGLEVKR